MSHLQVQKSDAELMMSLPFELQAYNKRPKVSDSLIPVQSSLYLCNVQDMKAWKYIDLTWSFSHFLNP
jgi:hypothetical protein